LGSEGSIQQVQKSDKCWSVEMHVRLTTLHQKEL
jgi:hypothetical protein